MDDSQDLDALVKRLLPTVFEEALTALDDLGWRQGYQDLSQAVDEVCMVESVDLGISQAAPSSLVHDALLIACNDAIRVHTGTVRKQSWSQCGRLDLVQWNDHPDRTENEVRQVLQGALTDVSP